MSEAGVIDTTHGVVADHDAALYAHRNLLDTATFARFLSQHPPYVSIREALEGKGDALTLDDSTVTAGDAARLARQCGHEVTLFVNGYNVVSGEPYFFSRLALALDRATRERVIFDGVEYALTPPPAKARFRKVVKQRLATIGSEERRQAFVAEVAELIGASIASVPPHLQPLTRTALEELRDAGVDVQNHGWTHVRVGALEADEHAADIARGRQWLREELGIDADIFAVPNGDGLPLWRSSPHYSMWLLLDDDWPLGEVGPGVYNRRTLEL